MTERKVISRRRVKELSGERKFNFTREMIPFSGSNGRSPDFVKEYREKAWNKFQEMPFPSSTDEPWRRTDIKGLTTDVFRLPEKDEYKQYTPVPKELLRPLVGKSHGGQIVMKPGGVQIEISDEIKEKGVIFTDLMTAESKYADSLNVALGHTIRADEGKFAALAASLASAGLLIYVPRGVQLEQPLHSVVWGPGVDLAYLTHIMVWLEDGASLTYVHETASPTERDGQTMHAGLIEVQVGAGANLKLVELQSWGEHVWNFSHERVRVAKDGNLDWIFVAEGSRLTKSFYDLDLVGEGATGRMSGYYFTDGKQHLDHDTQQNHLAPNTTSDLLFKGALLEQSRSVWQGMIYVAPEAQKTDGYQANRNMVLSREARADSIPGLEILADDVRCTHGATVGKIDPNELFYLQSRGIPPKDAERLIVEGFFEPILQRIPFEGVRGRLSDSILSKMKSI